MIGEPAPLLPNEEVRENLAQYLELREGQAVAETVSAPKAIAERSQTAAGEILAALEARRLIKVHEDGIVFVDAAGLRNLGLFDQDRPESGT